MGVDFDHRHAQAQGGAVKIRAWLRSHARAVRAADLVLRVGVTAGMLALILRAIDVAAVWKAVRHAHPALLAAALALQLASNAVTARQWQLVMRNLRFGGSAAFYQRSFFKSTFFNQAMPALGGDALRVLDVARRGFRKRDAAYAVFLDRTLAFAALTALSLAALGLERHLLPPLVERTIAIVMGAGLAGSALVFCVAKLPLRRRAGLVSRLLRQAAERARRALSAHRVAILALALAAHVLSILSFFALGRALGLPFGPIAYGVVVPPAIVLSGLPVSIAGWGVREGTLVALFSLAGADGAAVLALSLTYGVVALAASLPGLAVFLDRRGDRAGRPADS